MALDYVGNAQRKYPDKAVLYIDKEHGLEEDRMINLGVDPSRVEWKLNPKTGEDALDMMYEACVSDAFSLIALDSIAILEPSAEILSSKGEEVGVTDATNRVGLQGKMMSTAMRRLVRAAWDHNVGGIFINQMRDKVGEMYGPKETTPGGRAVKFASSARVRVQQIGGKESYILRGGETVGHHIEATVVKNRMGAPGQKAGLELYYAAPLDTLGEVITLCLEKDVIVRAGNSYMFNGQKVAVGSEALRQSLVSNSTLKAAVIAALELVLKEESKALPPAPTHVEDGPENIPDDVEKVADPDEPTKEL